MRERGSQAGGCGGGFWERLGAGGVNVRWVDGAGFVRGWRSQAGWFRTESVLELFWRRMWAEFGTDNFRNLRSGGQERCRRVGSSGWKLSWSGSEFSATCQH